MGKIKVLVNRTVLAFGVITFVSGMVILLYAVPKKYTLIPVGGCLSAFSVYSFIYLLIQRGRKCPHDQVQVQMNEINNSRRRNSFQVQLPGYNQHPPNYQYHENYTKVVKESPPLYRIIFPDRVNDDIPI